MENPFEETRGLKHRPVVLLPYSAHDGIYDAQTDTRYISIGWAQYDPRKLSVKTLRRPASERTELVSTDPKNCRFIDASTGRC